MKTPIYPHPAAPARAIPPGEEPLVTRAKVCAQLRTAIQILEGGEFDVAHIAEAQVHLKAAGRALLVARVPMDFPGLPAHVRVGLAAREAKPSVRRWCVCGAHLSLEMERNANLCVDCQALAAGQKAGGQA